MAIGTGTALAVGAVASVASNVIGGMKAGEERNKARRALNEAEAIINETGLPPDLSKEIIYQKFQEAGVLTPEMENELNLGFTQVEQMTQDESRKDPQMRALESLQRVGRLGMTPEERAQLNETRQGVQRDAEAKRQQILQDMQMRGQSGSGAELAAQLSTTQAATDRASEEGDRLAAIGSSRALEAMAQAGQLGGQIRGQDLDEASAADEIAKFRLNNEINRGQRNVDRLNAAEAANLENKQGLANMNTQQANSELLRQRQEKGTYWERVAQQNRDRATARQGQAAAANAAAQQKADQWSGVGSGIADAASAYGTFKGSQLKAPTSTSTTDELEAYAAAQNKRKYGF